MNDSRGTSAVSSMAAPALALAATVLWAGNFVLARGLRDDIPPVSLTFWRWTIATAVLAVVVGHAAWRARHAIRQHLGHVAATGFLGISLYNVLVYQAGHTTEAVNLALVAVVSPVAIVLLARVVDSERITAARAGGLAVAATGVVLLVTDGSPARALESGVAPGDLLMLVATVVFAAYTLLVRRRPGAIGLGPFTLACFLVGVLLLLPAYLVELLVTGPFPVDSSTVAALAYIGTGPSLLAFVAWNTAVSMVGASRPALVYYLVPVFTGLGSWVFLDEPVTAVHVTAAVLVVAGVALGSRPPVQQSPRSVD